MLTEAIFIRTMTIDRPEAIHVAFRHLSEGNNYSECIAEISKVGTGFDCQIKRDDDASVSLDLTLGGKVLLCHC